MGVFSSILASLLVVTTAQGAAEVNETPAEPISRTAPDYPAACHPAEGEVVEPQTVVVLFDVTKDGITENVRVMEASDSCFNETAIAAIRNRDYEPRRVNGAARPQEDLEVSFTFIFQEGTKAEDFDARPLVRVPPKYPDRCQGYASEFEYVVVQFDISTEGIPENIRAIESSRKCFIKAAKKSIEGWRYHPKTIGGKPVIRKSVVTTIEFRLSSEYRPPEHKYRNTLKRRLSSVRRSIRRGEDPQESLLELKEIEEEFGDDFSEVEIAQFYYLRAVVRIAAGDYAGALDDMHVVQSSGMAGDAAKTVDETIARLEAALAAEESTVEQTGDEAEPPQ